MIQEMRTDCRGCGAALNLQLPQDESPKWCGRCTENGAPERHRDRIRRMNRKPAAAVDERSATAEIRGAAAAVERALVHLADVCHDNKRWFEQRTLDGRPAGLGLGTDRVLEPRGWVDSAAREAGILGVSAMKHAEDVDRTAQGRTAAG